MKNKGFTLMELLAVIIVLAVIALITTPIVINTINDSKESSKDMSKELYIRAVDQAIAKYNIDNQGKLFSPSVCMVESDGNLLCDGKVQLKIDANGKKPQQGAVIYENGNIVNNTISFEKPKSKFEETCALVEDADNSNSVTIGDKYLCKVKKELEQGDDIAYYFYVLSFNDASNDIIVDSDKKAINSQNASSVNLIMSQNISSDGTKASDSKVRCIENVVSCNTIAWNDSQLNTAGPKTSITYLYNATKEWDNISPITFFYMDVEQHMENDIPAGFSIDVVDGVVDINMNIVEFEDVLRARMPIYFPGYIIEVDSKNDNNEYLYDNLFYNSDRNTTDSYWLLSTSFWDDLQAVYIDAEENDIDIVPISNNTIGIRPVITLGV